MNLFDKFSADYDKMINWTNRLAREGQFFQKLFAEQGVRRVLDLGCGTGQHAIMFAKWGLEVVGMDASMAMIDTAMKNARQAGVQPTFHTAGFHDFASKLEGKFDAVVLIGNSLPHLLSLSEVEQCLGDIYGVLQAKGLVIIQNRNYDKVLLEKERFMPLNSWEHQGEEVLFLRFNDFLEETINFNIITLSKHAGKWDYQVLTNPLRPISAAEMKALLAKTGWQEQHFYGDYQQNPYETRKSNDLIVVSHKVR